MTYKFEISTQKNTDFNNHYTMKNDLILSYCHNDYLYVEEEKNATIICLGYCFDIRYPEISINDTLAILLKTRNLDEEINFINGHFILIHRYGDETKLYTDASSLTPVYFSLDKYEITNEITENDETYISLNPNYHLDLESFKVNRFNELQSYDELNDEALEYYFLNLLEKQHKYFENKNLDVLFQADNYHKSLFAVLSPVLVNQNILTKLSNSKGFNEYFAQKFSKEFHMNMLDLSEENNNYSLNSHINYLARNNLSNFKALYKSSNKKLQNRLYIDLYKTESESEDILNYEMNLMDLNIKSNIFYSEEYLLFEPLNVREILSVFIELNKRLSFNIHLSIIDNLKPSLNYYNFTNGKTLKELNKELKQELVTAENNRITSQNQKFLLNVKTTNFKVSQNLDGKVKRNEILIYPSHQRIKKDHEYKVEFINSEEGLIYIEGFYKNPNNGKKIVVIVNGEKFNIFDFYGGRYFYFDGECNITFRYTQDYDSLSWQKAGTLLIKKY